MPASEARIAANRANALKSTGPKTEAGKEKSRANALKHGLTGAGVVLPNEDADEVERTFAAFEPDFGPVDEMGRVLIRRAATCAVRMERAVLQETAALTERVEKAQAEAEANGEDPVEAGHRAMFDPSKEACLARKYEAAAERGFFRAIKEFRQHRREAKAPALAAPAPAPVVAPAREPLGSFSPEPAKAPASPKPAASTPRPAPSIAPKPAPIAPKPAPTAFFDLPFTIGKAG